MNMRTVSFFIPQKNYIHHPIYKAMEINIEERKKKAVNYFREGYNCAQAVLLAFADVYELEPETAKKISASFGGGMGRLREVCGAVSGMFMVMGLQHPAADPSNKEQRTANYAAVQRTANTFSSRFGTIICRELLDVKRQKETPEPSERNAEYYAKRPCARFVAEAAEITARELAGV